MGVATRLIGLLPGYHALGVAAPVLLASRLRAPAGDGPSYLVVAMLVTLACLVAPPETVRRTEWESAEAADAR